MAGASMNKTMAQPHVYFERQASDQLRFIEPIDPGRGSRHYCQLVAESLPVARGRHTTLAVTRPRVPRMAKALLARWGRRYAQKRCLAVLLIMYGWRNRQCNSSTFVAVAANF